jgi:hypothetical protein
VIAQYAVGEDVRISAPTEPAWDGLVCIVVEVRHNGRNWRYRVCPLGTDGLVTAEFAQSELASED